MKSICTFFSVLILAFSANAQLQLLNTSHQFNTINETQIDSFSLVFNNLYPFNIEIVDVVGFDVYQNDAFWVSDSNFIVEAFDSKNIWVYFNPQHNIAYSQQILFHTKSRGDFSLNVLGQGKYSNTYYQATQNLSEEALKSSLKTILGQGYNSLGYNTARDKMYGSIDNVNGDVECVYTGRVATFNTRNGANSNNFNCEHTWPQSLFNSNEPMKSDIHHLYSTDVNANSQRGNLPFGMVSGNGSWNQGGSKKGNGVFEPRDAQKGSTARSMMYFVIRYQNYANFFTSQETLLRQWHNTFAPDAEDRQRNNAIYAEQNNRNPFVDYPQLEKRITSFSTTSVAPQVDSLFTYKDTVAFRNMVNGDSLIYKFVLINAGNQDIDNIAVTQSINTEYVILNPPSNVSLQPGEALTLDIYMIKPLTTVHSFTINTSIGSFNKYVTSGPDIGLDEWIANHIDFYPNPTIDDIRIIAPANEFLSYQLVDAKGAILKSGSFRGQTIINTTSLKWGNYFINIYRNGLILSETILKVSR